MAVSSRPDNFFQTTSSIGEHDRKARKSYNLFGDPIKLPSKLLAVTTDPSHDGAIYVAESAGTLKRILLETDSVTHTYRGPTAPLTSICFSLDKKTIYAGCWDKTIWSWNVATCKPLTQYKGHTDFVKSVLTVPSPDHRGELLISGGAEGDILFWDPSSGRRLHIIRGEHRAITDLALDPLSSADSPTIFVATSERAIRHFTLPAESSNLSATKLSPDPILAHETSVYRLFFDADGDLWTASADKTAKHLVREGGWKAETTLPHPDFIRDIIIQERAGWVITACRDEEVRVWNTATGALHHTFSGHFEEVTGLCLVGGLLVSVSIDATIRRWPLTPQGLQKAIDDAHDPKTQVEADLVKPSAESMLTEEEERELQELMANEESELMDRMANDDQ